MQKAKNKPTNKLTKLMFLLVGLAVVLGSAIFFFLSPSANGQIRQTTLPDELRPTAEALLETMPFDTIQLTDMVTVGLYRFEMSPIDSKHFGQTVCIAGYVPVDSNYQEHSQIIVNGKAVSDSFNITGAGSILPPSEGFSNLTQCVEGNLQSGLHLIEYQLRDTANGEPIATQQWAFEVD